MFPHGITVTRKRAGLVTDPYSGTPKRTDWDHPETLEVPGCAFDPGGSSEPQEIGRNAVITQPTIYDPSYADIAAGDRVEVAGRTYEVDGDPAAYAHPVTGWTPGQVVRLRGVEG